MSHCDIAIAYRRNYRVAGARVGAAQKAQSWPWHEPRRELVEPTFECPRVPSRADNLDAPTLPKERFGKTSYVVLRAAWAVKWQMHHCDSRPPVRPVTTISGAGSRRDLRHRDFESATTSSSHLL